jgi:orotate phosphoribosyltransferase
MMTQFQNNKDSRKHEAAAILLQTRSVLFSPSAPFTLTSGRKSPVYIDCRRLIGFPKERARLMKMAEECLASVKGGFDVIAGGETAGIPYAAFLSERLNLPMAYIRKKPKGFGRNARIEGVMEEGQNVLLVEDLATDGGSKISFIEAIREVQAHCAHCFVIFYYGIFPETLKKLENHGVTLHWLTEWSYILEEAVKMEIIDQKTENMVRSFLKNPDGQVS